MSFIFERKINYYETDKMGIVHHSNYIRFLEEARCAFMKEIGMPYSAFEQNGIMIPVLGVNCSYKYPVSFDDTLEIHLDIVEFNGVRMKVEYILKDKSSENLVLTAETKHCFTDKNLKPISLKKLYPDLYENFNKVVKIKP